MQLIGVFYVIVQLLLLTESFLIIGPIRRNVKHNVLFSRSKEDAIDKILSTLPTIISTLSTEDAVDVLSTSFLLYHQITTDKDKVIERILDEKEKARLVKDKEIERILDEKEKARLDKDKEIERILDEKEKARLDKDKIISLLIKESMQAKGLMTSRGIFERILLNVFYDLRKSKNEIFVASNMISMIDNNDDNCNVSEDCTRIREWCKQFSVKSLRDLYSLLSSEIHGSPWSGDSVKVYTKQMPVEYKCFLLEVAKHLKLDVEEVDEVKIGED